MYRTCRDCGHPIAPRRAVAAMPEDERHTVRRHHGRGLCNTCWQRAKAAGTLDDHPADGGVPREVVAQEWEFLADPCKSDRANIDALAEQLGMSEHAIEHALRRLRHEGRLPKRRVIRGTDGRFYSRGMAA